MKPIYKDIYKMIYFSMDEVLDLIHKTILYTEYKGNIDEMNRDLKKTNTKIIVIESTCKSICGIGALKTEHNSLAKKFRAMSYN